MPGTVLCAIPSGVGRILGSFVPIKERSAESSFCSPTTEKALTNRRWRELQFTVPLLDVHRSASKRDRSVEMRAVIGLSCGSGPATVSRFIPAEIVDSIDGEPIGTWPKISVERLEGMAPTIAHGNARSAVFVEVGAIGVEASLFSPTPGSIGSRSGKPMGSAQSAHSLTAETATALRTPGNERCRRDGSQLAA